MGKKYSEPEAPNITREFGLERITVGSLHSKFSGFLFLHFQCCLLPLISSQLPIPALFHYHQLNILPAILPLICHSLTSGQDVPCYCICDGCKDPIQFSQRRPPVIQSSRNSTRNNEILLLNRIMLNPYQWRQNCSARMLHFTPILQNNNAHFLDLLIQETFLSYGNLFHLLFLSLVAPCLQRTQILNSIKKIKMLDNKKGSHIVQNKC